MTSGKKRIWRLKVDLLRLRIAYRFLPERFRGHSAGLWVAQIARETTTIEASTEEISELTRELERGL